MNEGIEFTSSQIKAFENGATMFMFPVDEDTQAWLKNRDLDFIEVFAPIQKGDEFFIQEEFFECGCENTCTVCDELETNIMYRADGEDEFTENAVWQPASQMQEHQSRYRSECLNIRVARVDDNDYIFLIEIKGLEHD